MSSLAKPDDRSDNVQRLQENIANTQENMREADDFLRAHGHEMRDEDRRAVEDKKERRERAVDGFREEIHDETDRKKHS